MLTINVISEWENYEIKLIELKMGRFKLNVKIIMPCCCLYSNFGYHYIWSIICEVVFLNIYRQFNYNCSSLQWCQTQTASYLMVCDKFECIRFYFLRFQLAIDSDEIHFSSLDIWWPHVHNFSFYFVCQRWNFTVSYSVNCIK